MSFSLRIPLILSVFFIALGCSTGGPHVPTQHVIQLNRSGVALDPSQKGLPRLGSYEKYLNDMFSHLRERSAPRKIIIVIHGGLNTRSRSIKRAIDYSKILNKSGYFPIFINWESSLFRSYAGHLFHLRQGEYASSWYLAPLVLTSDLLRSAGRAPLVWVRNVKSSVEANRFGTSEIQRQARDTFCRFRLDYESGHSPLAISREESRGASDYDTGERIKYGVLNLLTLPTQLASSPVIDGAGGESWNVMLRNVELLFRRDCIPPTGNSSGEDEDYVCKSNGKIESETSGSEGDLSVFFQRLEKEVQQDSGAWEITLIGHSMGTIVANRVLQSTNIRFKSIVYMAAACSIEDYERSVFPYLARTKEARFYHLLLHDLAEVKETSASIFFPRGSLLVWIDDFLSSPLTLRQRTAGRFVNLARVLGDTPEELRSRIFMKVFSNGKSGPQRHGDFLRMSSGSSEPLYPFFSEEFWRPSLGRDNCCVEPGKHSSDDECR